MATIHEIAFRLEMRARRRRQAFFVVVNPDPDRVEGRNTIPDWYVREMASN